MFDPDILIRISLSPTEARDGFHRLMRDNVIPRAQRLISGTINITQIPSLEDQAGVDRGKCG